MNEEDITKAAETAETIEDGFKLLAAVAYEGLEPGTPGWEEARKVFYCGAAFLADRLIKWSESKQLDKIEAVTEELAGFAKHIVETKKPKDDNSIAKAIEEAWKYARPDKD